MDETLLETVGRTFRGVLERQAFMFADPADPGAAAGLAAQEGVFLASSIAFRGGSQGRIILAVPLAMAAEIASNFLGADAADPMVRARAGDACKELLNVICGHILTDLYGKDPVFDLSIPEASEAEAATVASWASSDGSLLFDVDGETVLLQISIGAAGGEGGRE